jgi:hypothetical protein
LTVGAELRRVRDELTAAARFFSRLPAFLRRPVTSDEAHAVLRRRRERRQADFLDLVRRAIYARAASPYAELLRIAGCEYGDLERLVREDGVEGALHSLYRHGVFLTVDEFKGRRAAIRGSAAIPVDPGALRNPLARSQVPGRSSGSRSGGTAVVFDLDFIRGCAVNSLLSLEARGGGDWLKADWEVPGVGGTFRLLKLSSFGAPVARWFSHVDPGATARYRWSARGLRWAARVAGTRLPVPEHAPIDAPLVIARWMADARRAGSTPYLLTFASSAVRLSQAAFDAGIDLGGAKFLLMGEPTTAARLSAVRRSGADGIPRYGTMEVGPIGYGCLSPGAPDDVHLFDDRHALLQPGPDAGLHGHPPQAIFVSSLRPAVPFVMLNVSMGDEAVVGSRRCGCAMERLGWTTHLEGIRSYEKLTAQGMTFLDTDVVRVLEEILPGRFGGAPTHYQLLEEEVDDSRPVLRLLVHPAVGPVDAAAVVETFLHAIAPGSGGERVMSQLWRDAALVRVERREPIATSSGKILHLHVRKS